MLLLRKFFFILTIVLVKPIEQHVLAVCAREWMPSNLFSIVFQKIHFDGLFCFAASTFSSLSSHKRPWLGENMPGTSLFEILAIILAISAMLIVENV